MKKFIVITLVLLIFSTQSFAQTNTSEKPKTGPRKQLATIVFAGLGGAVLGLSTLSFYGRPQDKLSNIAIGFAVGVIVGAVYTTYQTAKAPPAYTSFFPDQMMAEYKNLTRQPELSAELLTVQF